MRNQEWPELLNSYIKEHDKKIYKMGVFDCVTFISGLVKLITGANLLKGISYKGEKAGLTLLRKHNGLFNLTDKQMKKCGYYPYKNKAFTKRGDIVGFITETHGETLGVCIGSQFVSPGKDELVYLPMTQAVRSWGII
jgi:hypothetical protein